MFAKIQFIYNLTKVFKKFNEIKKIAGNKQFD
jgi:hypothetical protein